MDIPGTECNVWGHIQSKMVEKVINSLIEQSYGYLHIEYIFYFVIYQRSIIVIISVYCEIISSLDRVFSMSFVPQCEIKVFGVINFVFSIMVFARDQGSHF